MWQLIKQVIKSFKKSILLLVGLFLIAFAIIFATFSSLYLSSNISNSYNSLKKSGNGEDGILSVDNNNLKNNTLSFDYEIDLLNPVSSFADLSEYASINNSFAYANTSLYHSSLIKNADHNTWIFAYYDYEDNEVNPYFQADGINDADSLYKVRSRGILASYANLVIPDDMSSWRAFGLKLEDNTDFQYLVYEIDPLTGQTVVDIDNNYVNTLGYFNNGYYENTLKLLNGNIKYPTNVTASDSSEVSESISYQQKNGEIYTPFFETDSSISWYTDINYDLKGSSIAEILAKFNIVKDTTDTPDALNIISSFYSSTNYFALDKNIDWNLAALTPYYEYMRIFRDLNYLTNSDTNNPTISNSDFVFSIHLNMDNLSSLQKNTLNYVLDTYGIDQYIDLTSFLYTVNGSWIKSYLGLNEFDFTFNNLTDLLKEYDNQTAWDLVKTWIQTYGDNKLDEINDLLSEYEIEYLANIVLNQNENTDYNLQKSFNTTDYKTNSQFLVSIKDNYKQLYQNNNVNDLLIIAGNTLNSSYDYLGNKYNYIGNATKDQDIANALLTPQKYNGLSLEKVGNNYSLNENGLYLTNLVKFLNDSYIYGLSNNELGTQIKDLTSSLVNQINSGLINVNDYYHLFAIVSPNIYYHYSVNDSTWNDPNDVFIFSNQNIDFDFYTKQGLSPSNYENIASVVAPYGNSVVVSKQWLKANNKKTIAVSEWNTALTYSSTQFNSWKDNLDASYLLEINATNYIIIGSGVSYENAYPMINSSSPIINPNLESVLYVDSLGFNALLKANPSSSISTYFALKFNKNINKTLSNLNQLVNQYTNNAYKATNSSDNNILTTRISYPNAIKTYIQLFAILLIVVLVIIGVYLSFLLIRMYINQNTIALGIVKANGFNSLQIAFALSFFGLVAAVVSGFLGYLIAFLVQSLFLNLLSSYWYIPIITHNFSFNGLLGGIFGVYGAFLLFVLIGIYYTFKTPLNDLLTKNTDFKINKLLMFFKSSKIKINALLKFRFGLALSKLSRLIIFIVLCSFGLTLISVGVSIPNKFKTSQNYTLKNKQYDYAYDLQTPSSQSGLYKIQTYSELGTVDISRGINDIYNNIMYNTSTSPYATLLNENPDILALRNLDGSVKIYEDGSKKYFANYIFPSYQAIAQFTHDASFFRNAVVSKWLVDLEIEVAGIYINAWNYISNFFSAELIAQINSLSNNFVTELLKVDELKAINDQKQYIIVTSSGNYQLNPDSVVDLTNIVDVNSVRLNDDFLTFVGMVYGNETLANLDAKASFGIVPFKDLDESSSQTETYTYLDVILNEKNHAISSLRNKGLTTLSDIETKIMGIKIDSKYVTLVDKQNNSLNHYLDVEINESDQNQVFPLVINTAASYQYSLAVGDTINVIVTNNYNRYTNRMLNIDSNKYVTFQVVAINSDSFGTSFYTSQNIANYILELNLNQGASFVAATKFSKTTSNPTLTTNLLGDSNLLVNQNNDNNSLHIINVDDYTLDYIPFNGVFSVEQNPLLVNSLLLVNTNGIWANYSSFDDDNFASVISFATINHLLSLVIPYDLKSLNLLKQYYDLDISVSRDQLIEVISNTFDTNTFINWMNQIFKTVNLIAVNDYEYFLTTYSTYTTIFNTMLNLEGLLIGLFVPLIIIVVMIICSIMMFDFQKMIAILKTLGFNNKQNLISIVFVFLPVVIISLIIAIILLASLNTFLTFIIYRLASIYLTSSINWLSYFYGFITIILIVLINFIVVAYYLKQQNLRNAIVA